MSNSISIITETLVCRNPNPAAFPLSSGLVPPGRSVCFGQAVLRSVAVRPAQPTPSAALPPALLDFFLTHARNAGRRDLRCPFGCQAAHRKQRSIERSVAYYATEEGKVKKKIQTDKRVQREGRAKANPPVRGPLECSAGMLSYVAMVASLIQGRRVSEAGIGQRLVRATRQHSMARRRRIDYLVARLQRHGP